MRSSAGSDIPCRRDGPRTERALPPEVGGRARTADGIVEALDQITLATCVASSSEHDHLRCTLATVGLYDRFEGRIFSASEVANGKPAPDLFLHAAMRMGVDPAGCVVVEDRRYDVQAGRAAGMYVLAYAGGGMTPVDALAGPGTTVFEDMRRLPELLANLDQA